MLDKIHKTCESLAVFVSVWSGSTFAFIINTLLVVIWLVIGPFCNWSDQWQLWANTITTILTFLMVFLIQRTQNKSSMAIQMKLNELLAAHSGASNRLLNIENLSEEEIKLLQDRYLALATKSLDDKSRTKQHTVEEVK